MAAEPAAALRGPDPRAGHAARLLRWSWLVLWLSCLVPCTAGAAAAAEPTRAPQLRIESGMHTAPIWRIATDRAGRWAVTSSHDKTARVWEVATGRLLAVLRPPQDVGNEGKLYAVAMSPDGQVVAVAGWTGWDWVGKHSIYLFDRASGTLQRRIDGLANVVFHLAWSPDGRWLAASLWGKNGIRVFDAASGAERGRDADYGDNSLSVDFSADSRRLVSTSWDGKVRTYAVGTDGSLALRKAASLSAGQQPFAARYAPDGRLIAVGFNDSRVVQVLDAATLAERLRPDVAGVDNGDLGSVAWSADGRSLIAGGRWVVNGKSPLRRWRSSDGSRQADVPLAGNTVMDLVPLPAAAGGGWLFATFDPAWGVLDEQGRVLRRQDAAIADLRGRGAELRLAADAKQVRFGYRLWGADAHLFDLGARSLVAEAQAKTGNLRAADQASLPIKNWEDDEHPTLNGQALPLGTYETSFSLAIGPDGQRFVLGTSWLLRLFNRTGTPVWQRPIPGTAWAVNVSADGRFVVAGYADGTIRWHRTSDGEELLALFAHADRRRWIAWTPEGFYAASGADAEELIGYHLNQGRDREGRFVSARQLREAFYQPHLVSRRLDADGDALVAEARARLGDVKSLLAARQAPPVDVELLSDASVTTERDVTVKARLRNAQGNGRLIFRLDDRSELEGRPAGVAAGGVETRVFSLPPGRRQISVSAIDSRGIESQPLRVQADVRAPQVTPALHVLAVGVSAYRDRELQKGVRFAAGDARDVAQLFEQQGKRLYRQVNVRVLRDEQAGRGAIGDALRAMARDVAAQDVFVLYLAGHGASYDRDYHFIPYDAVYKSSDSLRQQSLDQQHLRDLLKSVPATKTLVLLDTCSAGGFGQQEGRAAVGQKDAIDRMSRLMGRATIAATEDDKMALEGEGGHGAFTHVLLEGLRGAADRDGNGSIEVRELADYIEQSLPELTRRRWGYEQFPFSATQGQSFTLLLKP